MEKPGSYSFPKTNFLLAASKFAQSFRSDTAAFLAEILQYLHNTQNNNSNFISATHQFVSNINKISFLKEGLSRIPWLKGALAFFDVMISGGKKSETPAQQTVQVMPMAINMTANLQGTISAQNIYHNIVLTNPGSLNAHLDPDNYPYYNEVLGVFNFLITPEVWWERRVENLNDPWNYPWLNCPTPHQPVYGQCYALQVNVDRFKLDTSTFKWVLNPAAGVTIQNMHLELIVEGEYHPNYNIPANENPLLTRKMPEDFVFNGRDGVSGDYKFGTGELLPIKNFAKRTWKVISNLSPFIPNSSSYYGLWGVWRPKGIVPNDTTAYLKVILNLKRNNAAPNTQNILYVLTYPVKLKPGGYMQYWKNDISYRYGVPLDTTLTQPPSPAEVNSFCMSNIYYQPGRILQRSDPDNPSDMDSLNKDEIRIIPNPNSGSFVLKLRKNAFISHIVITDVTGRRVYFSKENNVSLSNGYGKEINLKLPRGTYLLTVNTSRESLKTKFIVVN
ncbi:MAG: T9SS type A sorting domain-containing protein [Chitinophagaceae bacterium]|nr:T9SS type A sorting domain-containing protein [Chitinophagaceae bacterium]